MVMRPSALIVVLLLALAGLAAAALLIPRGGEKLVARASSPIAAATLRDCLGSKLGLTWSGDDKAVHATAFGLRVVITDNGKTRQIGMFTDGGRHLSSNEEGAMTACQTSQ